MNLDGCKNGWISTSGIIPDNLLQYPLLLYANLPTPTFWGIVWILHSVRAFGFFFAWNSFVKKARRVSYAYFSYIQNCLMSAGWRDAKIPSFSWLLRDLLWNLPKGFFCYYVIPKNELVNYSFLLCVVVAYYKYKNRGWTFHDIPILSICSGCIYKK